MTTHANSSRGGAVMVTALLLIFLATVSAAALLKYASHSSRLTTRALDYQQARIAAEAGLDYGIRELNELVLRYQFSLSETAMQGLLDNLPGPPGLAEYEYRSPSNVTAFRITVDSPAVYGEIPNGTVGKGELGTYQLFTITCGALNPETGVGAVLTQQVQATDVFLMRFGVFYELDMEAFPGADMVFDGPVHSNSNMYLGTHSGREFVFNKAVTSRENIYHKSKDGRSFSGYAKARDNDGNIVSFNQDGGVVDSESDTWMTDALTYWDGNIRDGSHGVPYMAPPINELDQPRAIIERKLYASDDEYHMETEREKFANKAVLRIHVNADGSILATDFYDQDVTYKLNRATLKTAGEANGLPVYAKTSDGDYEMVTEGSISTDQSFLDGRENATVAPVDLYVDQLLEDFPELATGTTYGVTEGRGVVYVTRDDPDGEGGVMPAVRLRNAREMPPKGLTVATDLPMYVEGNYNTVNREPCMVAADAVSFLSTAWQDANSGSLNQRTANSTEYYTVVMTGNTETQTGSYNGGLENVLRFLEKWSGKTATFRGSIITLWHSEIADSDWTYGDYYTAPNRDWGFDTIFRTQAPPGAPRVFGMEMLTWRVSSWEEQGWQAN